MAGLQTLDPKNPEALHDIGQNKVCRLAKNSSIRVRLAHHWLVENK